jgi:hypothetical protein
MNKPRFTMLVTMILAAAASRLIPHPPSFTVVGAMALFGGTHFSSKRAAFLVPLTGLALSDIVLGFYTITPVVYGSFALTVCLGFWVRRGRSAQRVAIAASASAILFFMLTNFGVWAISGMYPRTASGLVACYVAALPFLQNMFLGNLFYSAILFGAFALAENRFIWLGELADRSHAKQGSHA